MRAPLEGVSYVMTISPDEQRRREEFGLTVTIHFKGQDAANLRRYARFHDLAYTQAVRRALAVLCDDLPAEGTS